MSVGQVGVTSGARWFSPACNVLQPSCRSCRGACRLGSVLLRLDSAPNAVVLWWRKSERDGRSSSFPLRLGTVLEHAVIEDRLGRCLVRPVRWCQQPRNQCPLIGRQRGEMRKELKQVRGGRRGRPGGVGATGGATGFRLFRIARNSRHFDAGLGGSGPRGRRFESCQPDST